MMNKAPGSPSKIVLEPVGSDAPDATLSDPDEDFRLVALAQQGDMKSYDALVTRHRGKIYAIILIIEGIILFVFLSYEVLYLK